MSKQPPQWYRKRREGKGIQKKEEKGGEKDGAKNGPIRWERKGEHELRQLPYELVKVLRREWRRGVTYKEVREWVPELTV